jgi:hypothetical protein
MPRLTVELSEETYRALKQTAARRDVPMRQIIEESLEFSGIKTREQAREIVARARERADLSEQRATELAVDEVQQQRASDTTGADQ